MIAQQSPMKKPFYYALGLHGGIILFLLISSLSFFSEKIFQEQSVDVISANALMSVPAPAAPQPAPKPAPPVSKPQKRVHHRTITNEKAVEETVVKHATIAKQEHLSKTKPHKAEKKNRAKQLARQKELAHEKAVAHQKAIIAQNHLKALHAAQVQGVVDHYQAMILQAISQQWMVPSGIDKSLSCTLSIQLAPDGTVLNVSLVKGSGNVLLDRSAVAAVYKASPLPVPKDADAFESFRNINLIVRPEDIISS